MMTSLSANAQAILLLTAHLIVGRSAPESEALSLEQYNKLAKRLQEVQSEPADLLSANTADLKDYESVVDIGRLQRLLGRGFQLSQAVEHWGARAIWVVSRPDSDYPKRLRERLRSKAPPLLFGCGDKSLLDRGGIAVVGSRDADDSSLEYAMNVGRLAARAGRSTISGGAKGIDRAAMTGALEAGGRVCGVLADSLERQVMVRDHRNVLIEGQLTLVSPYDPKAAFHKGLAMNRNKLIYALADAALVVSSDLGKGGTWEGATEQLEKFKLGPLYVRSTGELSPGLTELLRRGARAWPNPDTPEALEELLNAPAEEPPQGDLALFPSTVTPAAPQEPRLVPQVRPASNGAAREIAPEDVTSDLHSGMTHSPSDTLFALARKLVLQLADTHAVKADEIATTLDVPRPQAKKWLDRLVKEGHLSKSGRPASYSRNQHRLI